MITPVFNPGDPLNGMTARVISFSTIPGNPLFGWTYNNGAAGVGATLTAPTNGVTGLTIDQVAIATGDIILWDDLVSPLQNGLYIFTDGTSTTPAKFTRHPHMDTADEFDGAVVFVGDEGTSFANTQWICLRVANRVVGTSTVRFNRLPSAAAGNVGDVQLNAGGNLGVPTGFFRQWTRVNGSTTDYEEFGIAATGHTAMLSQRGDTGGNIFYDYVQKSSDNSIYGGTAFDPSDGSYNIFASGEVDIGSDSGSVFVNGVEVDNSGNLSLHGQAIYMLAGSGAHMQNDEDGGINFTDAYGATMQWNTDWYGLQLLGHDIAMYNGGGVSGGNLRMDGGNIFAVAGIYDPSYALAVDIANRVLHATGDHGSIALVDFTGNGGGGDITPSYIVFDTGEQNIAVFKPFADENYNTSVQVKERVLTSHDSVPVFTWYSSGSVGFEVALQMNTNDIQSIGSIFANNDAHVGGDMHVGGQMFFGSDTLSAGGGTLDFNGNDVVLRPQLGTVAFSNSYSDLNGLPSLFSGNYYDLNYVPWYGYSPMYANGDAHMNGNTFFTNYIADDGNGHVTFNSDINTPNFGTGNLGGGAGYMNATYALVENGILFDQGLSPVDMGGLTNVLYVNNDGHVHFIDGSGTDNDLMSGGGGGGGGFVPGSPEIGSGSGLQTWYLYSGASGAAMGLQMGRASTDTYGDFIFGIAETNGSFFSQASQGSVIFKAQNLGGNVNDMILGCGSANPAIWIHTTNIVDLFKTIGYYNGVSTAAGGVPAIYAVADLTAQSAAKTTTTIYAVPSAGAGTYRISFVAKLTRAATSSSTLGGTSGFRVTYTDQDDSVATTTSNAVNDSGATLTGNTTQTVYSGSVIVNAKASTNIQYSFDYTSSGATTMQYNLHVRVERLG